MIHRRDVLLGAAGLAATPWAWAAETRSEKFVRRTGPRLAIGDRPYRFLGTNMWYAAYLGSFAEGRDRLRRELGRLADLGVTNIRVMGAAEDSPLKNSLKPAMHDRHGVWREDYLRGLDFFIAELAVHGQKAVIFLNNFWEWSGGMVTYQYWTNGGHYIDLGDPAHPWPEFADYSAQFYASPKAVALADRAVRHLVERRNSVTGTLYRDDPAIMAWQLANEPRPGGSEAKTDYAAYYAWIDATAKLIKRLDPNHLVSTGNEGLMGCMQREDCVVGSSSSAAVDYVTCHIWPLNWGWIDPANFAATFEAGLDKTRAYVAAHVALAARLGKPLVIEEFGLPRDGGEYATTLATTHRDRLYDAVFAAVEESAARSGPLVGTNFWAWGGEGRAQHPDFAMRPGDTAYVGDPPQEPQGRNSVFDCDASTLALIRTRAKALATLTTPA